MTRRLRASASDLRTSAPASPATAERPDPGAWSIARELADGDTSLLVVLDARTVLVRNS